MTAPLLGGCWSVSVSVVSVVSAQTGAGRAASAGVVLEGARKAELDAQLKAVAPPPRPQRRRPMAPGKRCRLRAGRGGAQRRG